MVGGIDVVELLAAAYALMFAVAVAGKVSGRERWSELVGRVAPRRFAAMAALAVPAAEALVAALLLVVPALGLAAAAVVLGSFAVVLASRIERLEGTDCGCFGALAESRIGRGLIARNFALAALAGGTAAVAAERAASAPGPAELLLAPLALGLGVAVARLLHRPAHGPRRGARVQVPGLGAGRPAVLVFLLPGCPSCVGAGPALAALDEAHIDLSVIAVLGDGSTADRGSLAAKIGPRARLDLTALMGEWRIEGAPFAVAIDASGRVIDTGFGAGPAQLERMAYAALEGRRAPDGIEVRVPDPRGRSPLERLLGSVSRRQALASIGAATLVPMLAGPAGAKVSRAPRRRRQTTGPRIKERIVEVKGSCQKYKDFKLPLEYCQVEGSGGCTFYDGFLDNDDSKITSKLISYDEVVVNKGGVYCPSCATEGKDTCFKTAVECVDKCKATIGSCAGRCGASCNEQVCIEAVVTQGLDPQWRVTLTKWIPPKSASKKCRAYAKQLNEQVRMHEVDGHLASGLKAVEIADKQELQNQTYKYCKPTYAEAKAEVEAAMQRSVNRARRTLNERFIASGKSFHSTEAGKNLEIQCSENCGK